MTWRATEIAAMSTEVGEVSASGHVGGTRGRPSEKARPRGRSSPSGARGTSRNPGPKAPRKMPHEQTMLHTTIRFVEVDGHAFRAGIKLGEGPPLLIFNGIGANLELLEPFTDSLGGVETIVFDLPGVGETPPRMSPYRMRGLARTADRLLDKQGHQGQVDLLGVSWAGALAQQL